MLTFLNLILHKKAGTDWPAARLNCRASQCIGKSGEGQGSSWQLENQKFIQWEEKDRMFLVGWAPTITRVTVSPALPTPHFIENCRWEKQKIVPSCGHQNAPSKASSQSTCNFSQKSDFSSMLGWRGVTKKKSKVIRWWILIGKFMTRTSNIILA